MESKINYGCGMLGLIGVCGFFAFCGLTCAMLDPLYDDCMDDVIFHSIESNGRAILNVEELDGRKSEEAKTVTGQTPFFATSKLKDGNTVLKINQNGKTWSRTDSAFSDDLWSSREQCYYFIENKMLTVLDRKSLMRWSPAKGFEKLLETDGYVMSMSLSLDQQSIVIDKMEEGDARKYSFITYRIGDGQTDVVSHPDWASHPIMTEPNKFLVRRHETGNYGHVVRWSPGQKEKPHDSKDGSWIDGGEITDVASLRGEVWGLYYKNGSESVVRLSADLSRVVQDIKPKSVTP